MITTYLRPETVAEAVRLRREHPAAAFLAGGTYLLSPWAERAPAVVSLDRLPLRFATETEAGLELGPLVTLQELAVAKFRHPAFAALPAAARHVNNRNVRNQGTVGGNIAGGCSSADLLPILLALDATLVVAGADGKEGTVSVADYLAGDRAALIVKIAVPAPGPAVRAAVKTFTRTANDIALANVALACEIAGGKIVAPRVAAGCYAARPIRVPAAEKALAGLGIGGPAALEWALRPVAEKELQPRDDHRASAWYRRELFVALLLEAAASLTEGGR